MHTDTTLQVFRQTTTLLGDALRYFANETCKHFKTFETDKEYQARTRATARRVAKESAPGSSTPALSALGTSSSTPGPSSTLSASSTPGPSDALGASSTPTPSTLGASINVPPVRAVLPSTSVPPQSGNSGKRPKFFNVATPKTHFFPDYAGQIEAFGTTDNLSTQLVSDFN